MTDDKEESVEISVEECRRWSTEINNRLETVRAQEGEEAYRRAFMTAFLLLWFADSVEEPEAVMKITKSVDRSLN